MLFDDPEEKEWIGSRNYNRCRSRYALTSVGATTLAWRIVQSIGPGGRSHFGDLCIFEQGGGPGHRAGRHRDRFFVSGKGTPFYQWRAERDKPAIKRQRGAPRTRLRYTDHPYLNCAAELR